MTIQNMQMHLHRGVMDEMSRKDALQKQSVAARWKKIHDFLLNQGAKEDDAAYLQIELSESQKNSV